MEAWLDPVRLSRYQFALTTIVNEGGGMGPVRGFAFRGRKFSGRGAGPWLRRPVERARRSVAWMLLGQLSHSPKDKRTI